MNFKDKYSNLISQVASDNLGNFAALSSPTLSKQETVTGLFEIIKNDNVSRTQVNADLAAKSNDRKAEYFIKLMEL